MPPATRFPFGWVTTILKAALPPPLAVLVKVTGYVTLPEDDVLSVVPELDAPMLEEDFGCAVLGVMDTVAPVIGPVAVIAAIFTEGAAAPLAYTAAKGVVVTYAPTGGAFAAVGAVHQASNAPNALPFFTLNVESLPTFTPIISIVSAG